MLDGFKKFILRGNALDLAIGGVIGASFGSVVNSLVTDILTPLIGAISKTRDFSELSVTINGSVIMYGNFINSLVSLILVAVSVYFFVVIPMNKISDKIKK